MTQEEENKLKEALENLFYSNEYKELLNIVLKLKGKMLDNPSIERSIDNILITQGSWIYDTINDNDYKLTKKIKRILGYT